jgi:chromosome segregation ATPase
MTAERIRELTAGADAAQAEVERLDSEIANALADGDEAGLAELRDRRRALIVEADDVASAIEVLNARANDPQAKLRAAMAAGALRDARRRADEYRVAAQEVDDAIATLEAKFGALETSARTLSRSLIAAGVGDAARIYNTLQPSLRWALWRSSPRLAKAMGVAHTPFVKRRTLRDSASRVIPNIPSE